MPENKQPRTEYVCSECGQTVYNALGAPAFDICGECLHMPGWHLDPRLRAMLGPNLPPLGPIMPGIADDDARIAEYYGIEVRQ